MKKQYIIFTLSLCTLLLLPILFFPISNDLSIFYHTAKTILEGGKLYKDYIDIKPPLGYIIFVPIVFISGHHEFLLRLIDLLIQLIIIYLLFRLISNRTHKPELALISCAFYSIAYVSLNFNQTMQLESFMGLLTLLLIKLEVTATERKFKYLLRGILFGLLISIKFTTLIIYFAFLLNDIIKQRDESKNISIIIKQTFTFSGLIITLFLANILLLDSDVFIGFSSAMKFLMTYGSQPALNLEFLKFSLKQIAEFFGDNYSLFLLMSFLIGTIYIIKNHENKLYHFSLNLIIFLFISIVLERKYFEYHFLRMYIPLSIIAGYGFYEIMSEMKTKWKVFKIEQKIVLYSLIFFFILFSPIPRWIQTCIPVVYYFTSKIKYDEFYEKPWTSSILRKTSREVADFINKHSGLDDNIIVISNINNQINFFIDRSKKSRFALSCFYLSSFNIEYYNNLFFDELKNANWLIVQTNDGNQYAMGHLFSSYDALLQNHQYMQLLIENFNEVKEFSNFKLFARK